MDQRAKGKHATRQRDILKVASVRGTKTKKLINLPIVTVIKKNF
jgi:hypothetical protein